MLFQNLMFFVLAIAVLILCGTWLVRALSYLAFFLRMNEFVAAFFLMAFSTSIPELFVGINSALSGAPSLSLGTVIGSNIADITLIAGIGLLFSKKGKVKKEYLGSDAFLVVFIAALPVVLHFFGNQLSRIDGVLLIVAFVLYFIRVYCREQTGAKLRDGHNRWLVIGSVLLFLIALVGVFFSAEYVVRFGSLLAIDLGAPPIFIGLFFLAVGTSLPELAFMVQSVRLKHEAMGIGNILGSVVVNATVILGVTAVIEPITADFFLFITSSAFMLITCFLFATFLETNGSLSKKEGVCLILFYVLFLLVELNVRNPAFFSGNL